MSNIDVPERQSTRPLLGRVRAETSFLAGATIHFTSIDRAAAQAFHDGLMAARERWLREKNRRLPTPDQLERERYGTPYRGRS